MKCRGRWLPATARFWSSTPRKAWRHRALPTATRRLEQGLEVLPVINKIDLPSADRGSKSCKEIEEIIGIDADRCGAGERQDRAGRCRICSRQLVKRIPPPKGDPEAPLQALIIDSWFDNYVGVVSLVQDHERLACKTGDEDPGDVHRPKSSSMDKLGSVFTPKSVSRCLGLATGDVGFVIAGIREIDGAPVGDTITLDANRPSTQSSARFQGDSNRACSPGLFPINSEDYESVPRCAGQAASLNDSALHYEPEVSTALGFGFRMRLSRPAAHGHRAGAPGARVQPRAGDQCSHRGVRSGCCTDGTVVYVDNPASKLPPLNRDRSELREPIITANILVPPDLCRRRVEAV